MSRYIVLVSLCVVTLTGCASSGDSIPAESLTALREAVAANYATRAQVQGDIENMCEARYDLHKRLAEGEAEKGNLTLADAHYIRAIEIARTCKPDLYLKDVLDRVKDGLGPALKLGAKAAKGAVGLP